MSKNGYRTSSFQAKRAASQAYCRGRNQQALCPDLVMQKSHPRPCKYPGTIKVKIRHNLTHPPIHQKKKSVTAFPTIAQQTTPLFSPTKDREPPAMLPKILTELPTLNVGTVVYTAIDNSDVHTKSNKDDSSSSPNGAMNIFSLGTKADTHNALDHQLPTEPSKFHAIDVV
jgi:hypothetical protein